MSYTPGHNSFLSLAELEKVGFKEIGSNVKISKNAQFYGAEHLAVGSNVRIDDFVIISINASSRIGSFVHLSPFCLITSQEGIEIEDYVTISSRVTIYGQSDDFSGGFITNPTNPIESRNVISARVIIETHAAIGTGATLLPTGKLRVGTVLGAMSLLKSDTEPWCIYSGIPAEFRMQRSEIRMPS